MQKKREAIRYLENAKEILSKSAIEDNIYVDEKYVKSACGVAYLGVLKAIEGYLLDKGLTKKELPKKVEEYMKAIQNPPSPPFTKGGKGGLVHDGKLLREFDALYDQLHIAGYYRGLLHNVNVVKDVFKAAKVFVERIK